MKLALEQFFNDNAGYNFDPKTETKEEGRIRCAKSLAKAAEDAGLIGIEFKWDYDDGADWSRMDEAEKAKAHLIEWCLATNPLTKQTASVSGIFDADENYRRIVEAELALELLEAAQ
jgi:hypothetical protein